MIKLAEFLKTKYFSYILIMVSILFIVIGINNGENIIVLKKAIRICMECIGLG